MGDVMRQGVPEDKTIDSGAEETMYAKLPPFRLADMT